MHQQAFNYIEFTFL